MIRRRPSRRPPPGMPGAEGLLSVPVETTPHGCDPGPDQDQESTRDSAYQGQSGCCEHRARRPGCAGLPGPGAPGGGVRLGFLGVVLGLVGLVAAVGGVPVGGLGLVLGLVGLGAAVGGVPVGGLGLVLGLVGLGTAVGRVPVGGLGLVLGLVGLGTAVG